MIFFLLFLMGLCWWIGLSYDSIYRSVRECAELKNEIGSADGKTEARNAELKAAFNDAADSANYRMSRTLSGRVVEKVFNFQRVRRIE
jgi:hypothetical protein